MPSDDELRRVAEDVRALARSLGRDIRTALDRPRGDSYYETADGEGHDGAEGAAAGAGRRTAREDLADARRAVREELWSAQRAVRESARQHRHRQEERWRSTTGPGRGCGPRWDNWGGRRYRDHGGVATDEPAAPSLWRGRCRDRREGRDRTESALVQKAPSPPIRHRHDGTTLVGLLAVVFGLAWLAAATNVASVSTEAVLAIALMVVGAATVVTARTDWALSGRKWPVLAGAAVGVALLAYAASPGLPVGFRHLQIGAENTSPLAWASVPPVIHAGIGKTQVDLSALPTPAPAPRTLTIDNAAGRLEITIPNVPVLLHAHLAAGQLQVNGVNYSGTGRRDVETLNPSAPGPPLTLNVDAGFGSVSIDQVKANVGVLPTQDGSRLKPTLTTPTLPPAPVAPAGSA